jgi:hypothetical protein
MIRQIHLQETRSRPNFKMNLERSRCSGSHVMKEINCQRSLCLGYLSSSLKQVRNHGENLLVMSPQM